MSDIITFGIYRVLGNDLPPRHAVGQTVKNTEFMLATEEKFPYTKRIWCLNRIYDKPKLEKLKQIIDAAGEEWFEIPFVWEVYRDIPAEQDRLHYATNVNPARNACLEHGLASGVCVTMVLDGGAFLPTKGFYEFEEMVYTCPPENEGAYAIPVVRAQTFDEFLVDGFLPQIKEQIIVRDKKVIGIREPYLAFTQNIDVRFNEDLPYGMVDKVELCWRLGMHGYWDHWEPHIRRQSMTAEKLSKFAGSVKLQGYSIRLPTHTPDGCADNLVRGHNRNKGKMLLVRMLDQLKAS